MTTQCDERACFETVLPLPVSYERRGPWSSYEREPRVRRKRCVADNTQTELHATFKKLVESWRDATWHISSIKKRTSHPDYVKIIGIGRPAIPWILQELRETPDYWFVALEAITRDDPAPNATTLDELRDAWLAWGEGFEC